jgi:type IV pilus assembly protein PilE
MIRNSRTVRGITLLELMIAVVIVGVLAAIAYPSYRDYVLRSHRADAQADLLELAQWLERRYTINNVYAGALPFNQTPRTGAARYNLMVTFPSTQSFTLTATPTGAQVGDTCGVMTLNQLGSQTAAAANCW